MVVIKSAFDDGVVPMPFLMNSLCGCGVIYLLRFWVSCEHLFFLFRDYIRQGYGMIKRAILYLKIHSNASS